MKPSWWYCLVLGLTLVLSGCGPEAAKPEAKTEMPSLVFADRYALWIARHQYSQSLAVSTPANAQMINNEIKPFLDQLAKKNHRKQMDFKEVHFLSAQVVQGDEGHLLVMEALIPSPALPKGERVLLSFEVIKKATGFAAVSTHARIYTGGEEW